MKSQYAIFQSTAKLYKCLLIYFLYQEAVFTSWLLIDMTSFDNKKKKSFDDIKIKINYTSLIWGPITLHRQWRHHDTTSFENAHWQDSYRLTNFYVINPVVWIILWKLSDYNHCIMTSKIALLVLAVAFTTIKGKMKFFSTSFKIISI